MNWCAKFRLLAVKLTDKNNFVVSFYRNRGHQILMFLFCHREIFVGQESKVRLKNPYKLPVPVVILVATENQSSTTSQKNLGLGFLSKKYTFWKNCLFRLMLRWFWFFGQFNVKILKSLKHKSKIAIFFKRRIFCLEIQIWDPKKNQK